MGEKVLMHTSEAIAEAAIRAGCQLYAGYPIAPSREVLDYFARRAPEMGRVCVLAEGEVGVINILYGAAAAGARCMTASSGTAISLMQECFSALARAELPCVVVNVQRWVLQGEYWKATKGGGHEEYRWLVLAPETGQEAADLTFDAFGLADRYRIPVMILGDYILATTTESIELPAPISDTGTKPWAATGAKGRAPVWIGYELNTTWGLRKQKYALIEANETRSEMQYMNDAELVVVAFGTASRFAKPAIEQARNEGIKVGLIRPITLWPFPANVISEAAERAKAFLVFELNDGQMVEDVRLAVNGRKPVHFYGAGWEYECPFYSFYGPTFSTEELLQQIKKVASGGK